MAFNGTDPLAPITRYSPEDRVFWFTQNAPAIYNKYSPYTNSSIGPEVPLIYNKLTDTSDERNRIAFDNQELPIVSTIVDVRRMGKMLRTGTGIKFLVNQNYNQGSNAFNETRIYNPLSLLSATAAKGSTGLIDRPVRFLPVSGGIGNFIATSLLSVVGIQSKAIENNPDGTATGAALSGYAKMNGLPAKGLIRYESGDSGRNRFNTFFPDAGTDQVGKKTPSFGSALGKALVSKLKSFIPSTNPFGFGGGADNKWEIRPEYKGIIGAYESMYADKGGMLAINNTPKPNSNSQGGFLDTIKSSLSAAFLGAPAKAPAF